ncbi:MAG: L,D-transpeptidase family protein [Selenomonadaceae bacterium]|nr:L,D-transpeptidase family protein [Selenomonadaceae bacterium]
MGQAPTTAAAAPAQAPPVQLPEGNSSPEVQAQSKEKKIVINIASRSLSLYDGGAKIRLYPLGLGKVSTPTPTGYYEISSKDVDPTWVDPTDTTVVVPSGPSNPLGYRWMLLYGHYGIHGTNRPESIGHYVSNGCVRMNESDVEALFDLVDVGTPVEITYNRIVVEKTADNTVVYYIYPDGYDCQPLDAAMVDKWLSGYGINGFVSDESILEKIDASDGEPTYIGKVYSLFVNGSRLSSKAVEMDGMTYLPASDVASVLQLKLEWNQEGQTLSTPYGKARGFNKKNILYFDALDMGTLFHLEGGLDASQSYVLKTKAAKAPVAAPIVPETTGQAPAEPEADPVPEMTGQAPVKPEAGPVPETKEQVSVSTEREPVPADEKRPIRPVIGLEEIN